MPSALIIGHEGQDGVYLSRVLRAKGYLVNGTSRQSLGGDQSLFAQPLNVESSSSVAEWFRVLRPDEVYFLAAFHHSSEDPAIDDHELIATSLAVNALALNNVLSAVAATCRKSRVFYASSSRVFGQPAGTPQDEATPLNPVCPYGISKEAGMRIAGYYRERHVYASCGILYNHESPLRRSQFISQKVAQASVRISRGSAERLIIGDLEAQVDWGYAEDYVDAMWRILQLDTPDDFVIGSGVLHSVRDLVSEAFRCVGLDWRNHVDERNDSLPRRMPGASLRADSGKLRNLTGWKPSVSFEELVQIMVQAAIASEKAADVRTYSA